MATFGSFETLQEVYYGPTYAVYSARKSGDSQTEYAIKVFFLLPANLAAEADGKAAPMLDDIRRSYIERVSLQQQAAAVSKFIAPILETGHDERGVWYATRFYGRSVNKMMNGRLAPNRQTLQYILRGLAQGALDLKRVCGRSHGEILPTNIQISRNENILEAEVVLSDPLPGDESDAVRYELADLRAIGQILLHLVLRRLITPEDDYLILPILSSSEWTQVFGKESDRWLAICNRLLDPNLSLDQYSLEQLHAELEEIRPKSRGPVKILLATAATLVALAIGAMVVHKRTQVQTVEVTGARPGATSPVNPKEGDGTPAAQPQPTPDSPARGVATENTPNPIPVPKAPEPKPPIAVASVPPVRPVVPVASARVMLVSEPAGATVWVGTNMIGTTPKEAVERPAGSNTFRFELNGFETTNITVVIAENTALPQRVTATLTTLNGDFQFSTDPAEATILDANGKELGRTSRGKPVKVAAGPGTHKFTAKVEGLADVTELLRIEKRELKNYTFVFDYGMVRMASQPPGASVSVEGRNIGTTPLERIQRPGAKVEYRIGAPDYLPKIHEVVVGRRETNSTNLILDPEPVRVAFHSNPEGAKFYSKGQLLVDSLLPWGTNTIVAKQSVYPWMEEVTNVVVVQKGSANTHEFKFNYGRVEFETTPAGADIFERGNLIARTPTNFYVRAGRVDYDLVLENRTNHVETNVVRGAAYRFSAVFERDRAYTNSAGMEFVLVKDGFYVSKFEVTEGQYHQVMGGTAKKRNMPKVKVSWDEAKAFCQKLSQMDGASAANARLAGWTYSLPTVTEWLSFVEDDPDQIKEAVFVNPSAAVAQGFDEVKSKLDKPLLGSGSGFGGSGFGVSQPGTFKQAQVPQGPKEIDFTRRSTNRYGIYDLFGNVAEWGFGATDKPMTTGGSYLDRPELWKFPPTSATIDPKLMKGADHIGLRCVLKPPMK